MQIEREARLQEFVRAMVQHSDVHPLPEGAAACAVLLCDRGTMDCKPFVAPEMWQRLLHSVLQQGGAAADADEAELCERRYDAVLHFGMRDACPAARSLHQLRGTAAAAAAPSTSASAACYRSL